MACGETKPKEEFTISNRRKNIYECKVCQNKRKAEANKARKAKRDYDLAHKPWRLADTQKPAKGKLTPVRKQKLDDRKYALELERIEKDYEL